MCGAIDPIYDATMDSLSVIPRLPDDLHGAMGHQSAVVMCEFDAHGEGYLLAELVLPRFSQAGVCLWVLLSGSHPLPSSSFSVYSCFSYRGSILCWVDLHKGMLLCDLAHQAGCNNMFQFIKLPQECPTYDDEYPNSVRPEEFRSMACVCAGHIKLIAMDEYGLELTVLDAVA
ncbi:hypothetical protein ZWY2020_010180 [Hordeum vulgare]|nr:hypothetical protein ZWY2020_025303 [Hordeum vulgare]KAI5009132.1 hypothetical protein ZWY2020_010180 [Hordeum vulgare]